jgi:hypothetical protein
VVLHSEDDDAMDIDSGSRKKQVADGLDQYKLDEYDDEAKTSSTMIKLMIVLLIYCLLRYGHIQQYQRPDVLQR